MPHSLAIGVDRLYTIKLLLFCDVVTVNWQVCMLNLYTMSDASKKFCDVPVANCRPTIKELQSTGIILEVSPKWYDLGVELLNDNQVGQLKVIEKNNSGDVQNGCREMFRYWLQSHPDANWHTLADALKEINKITTATNLEKRFSGELLILMQNYLSCTFRDISDIFSILTVELLEIFVAMRGFLFRGKSLWS